MGEAPRCGGQRPHLLTHLVRFARGSGWRCWGEAAEAPPAPRLLSPATLSPRHPQHCQGKPGGVKSDSTALGVTAKGGPGPLLSPTGEEEGFGK